MQHKTHHITHLSALEIFYDDALYKSTLSVCLSVCLSQNISSHLPNK